MPDQIRIVEDALDKEVEGVVARLATNVQAELIERTPVDTGWARANWVPGIGQPFTGNGEPLDYEARRAGVAAQEARQATATAALLAYQIERGPVFISNNVPYIGRLNEGSSTQAPEGFVQDAIAAAIRGL